MGNIEWKAVIINNFLQNSFSKEFELKLGQDQNPKISTILTLNQSSLTDFSLTLILIFIFQIMTTIYVLLELAYKTCPFIVDTKFGQFKATTIKEKK